MTADTEPPLPVDRVLDEEFRHLHGDTAAAGDVLARHGRAGHSALCLSGGGVRSASFALGVLQGLAAAGVLERFDYLSTVSGGGYIGGWLSAWRRHAASRREPDPCAALAPSPGRGEPAPLTRLRLLIKFLDPRVGTLSADVWTLGGTILRNLLVNWMVLVPLVAAAAMVPRLYLGVLGLPSQPELVARTTLDWWYLHDWIPILLLVAAASTYAAIELPSLRRRSDGLPSFLVCFLAPVLLVHFLFSIHRYWAWHFGQEPSLAIEMITSTLAMVAPWIAGGAFTPRWWRPWTWLAAAAAGAAGRLVIWWAHRFITTMAHHDPQAFTVVDLPASLALLFLQITAFIGLASRDMNDEDREWWARAGAWILIACLVWLVASGVSILGPIALNRALDALGVSYESGRIAAWLATLFSGGVAYRIGPSLATAGPAGPSRVQRLAFMLAAPAIVMALVVLVSDANLLLLRAVHALHLFNESPHPIGASLPEDLLTLGSLLVVGLALGRVMSINDFSLHGMYRDRLIRTFLGVSRSTDERRPSPFTGFDTHDDIELSHLASLGRPFHVVNTTLNLVAENRLATADRKAASFTMSALHAGSRDTGYRPSAAYGGGLTLGQALTTSGAAVSPNMGAASTPALTFLLTVLNARLGVWLGNPGLPGDATWRRRAPAFGVAPLIDELLGRTTDRSKHVYLSDGGHFENLGLYEMILRRCRYIVVSDAGADPSYVFSDLGTAIRAVRLDFGVDIDFPAGVRIGAPGTGHERWAIGRIRYSAIDPGLEDGILVYLKPTLIGDEPVDVTNYSRTHPAFPQEPTTEQWFAEAQFESYRLLGLQTAGALCAHEPVASVRDLCVSARDRAAGPAVSHQAEARGY